MTRDRYAALVEISERIKLRDLAAFARLHKHDQHLTRRIAHYDDTVIREASVVSSNDISATLAFQRFATLAKDQTDKLRAEKRALAAEMDAARAKAMRANGRMEALKMLQGKDEQERRRRQDQLAERLLGR